MSDVEATTLEVAEPQKQAETTEDEKLGVSNEEKTKPEAQKETICPEVVDDGKVWYYGSHTPLGTNFKRIVEVNPKNRHETQLMELGEDDSLGRMVYSQGKYNLLLFRCVSFIIDRP